MGVVYHQVPPRLVGDVLVPLHRLAELDATAHAAELAKYDGRETLLELRLPGGLLWNDVLHCAPLHPHLLFAARLAHGLAETERRTFFEIPLDRVASHPVFWLTQDDDGELQFEPFDPTRYRPLDRVPEAHLSHLRERAGTGRPARPFAFVPHVLVAGPIEVAGLRTVRWDEPPP